MNILLAKPMTRTQHASGSSCDRPSRHRFLLFSSVLKQKQKWFPRVPRCHCMFLKHIYWVKFIKIKAVSTETTKLSFHNTLGIQKLPQTACHWTTNCLRILLYFNTLYRVHFIISYYDQQMHNYFTNYHTPPTRFDTIASSSGSS
jgi:hypothetical protein